LGTSRLRTLVTRSGVGFFVFFAAATMANAQFKVVGPAPYSPTVARQKIRMLLEGIDPSNSQKTIATLSGLLSWYRDILDEELIAAWQKDTRANVTEVIKSLADSRAASEIVEFSWRERRKTAFNLAYAPILGNLMARFPESAKPFLDDLLPVSSGKQSPDLSQPEAETVCRILLDMPDIGTWRMSALQILPRYRRAVESLLVQDLHGDDQEKMYQAQRWQTDLKLDVAGNGNEQPSPRRRSTPSLSSAPGGIPSDNEQPGPSRRSRPSLSSSSAPGGIPPDNQTESVILLPRASDDRTHVPAATSSAPALPSIPAAPAPSAPLPSAPPLYSGARSGTLESSGGPIPQNAEYVFHDVPLVKMRLDYDTKTWDARLVPGERQTQRLILRNKSSGPQKRCVVHWSVIP
jgi:hypothetical protein